MTPKMIFYGLLFILVCLVKMCYTAVVDVNQTSSLPRGLIVVPQNMRTSALNITFNETVQDNNILVVCSTVESVSGLTRVLFQNKTALIGQKGTVIQFSILSPGQPITVQCSAQSEGSSMQFTFLTSKGKPGYLQVSKAPTVTICTNPVLVTTDRICQTVQVLLSEEVSGLFPAVVNCSVVDASNDGPQFRFEPSIIDVGKKTVLIPYVTISTGLHPQMSVQVVCLAQTYNVTRLTTNIICGKGPVESTTMAPATTPPISSNRTNITTTSATNVIPTPLPPPEIIVPQFSTSREGVEYFQYLTENSAGAPVTFTLNPLILQFYPKMTSIHGSYSIILSLNTAQTIPLSIDCSLTSLPAGSINTSHIYCPTEANDAVKLASSSVQLKLAETEIQFKISEVSKTLNVAVIGSPVARVRDLVQLSCCPKVTSVLKPSPVGAFLWIDLPRQQPIDLSSGSTSTSSLDIDLTCPCDLKELQCDTGCCCDQDCTSNERTSFSCIRGLFGGDAIQHLIEFSCQATWPDSTDVHPFLCVTISNSPLIGYWFNYTTPPTAKDLPEYSTLLRAAKKTRFTYQTSAQTSSLSDGIYKAGMTIKTAANANDNQYFGASLGILSLPRRIFSGLCSQFVPVRFLENSKCSCTTELTESLCTASSPLSASSFLMSKEMTSPPCPIPAAVLKKGALGQTQREPPELAEVEVQYYCTADSREFVSVKDGPRSRAESGRLESSIWRCGFDDGKEAPPLPVFNSTSKICSNVVLNVTYHFETSGQEISKVIASVTLGNVQISTPQPSIESSVASTDALINTITQLFSSQFSRSSLLNTSGLSDGNPAMNVSRSGNPGYIKGLPLLGLKNSRNEVVQSQLHIRSPSANSLCSSTLSTPILYGEALTSGCLMKLGFSDMRNCTLLKELVRTNHEALLNVTHIGRTGNARVSIENDWLPIIRDNIKDFTSTENTSGDCADIPHIQKVQVLVSQAGLYGGVPQMEVVGLRISYEYTTWRYRCVSGYSLSCLVSQNKSNENFSNTSTSQNVTLLSSAVTPAATVSLVASSSAALNASSVVQENKTTDGTLNGSSVLQGNKTTNGSYSPREMLFMIETRVVFITVPATEPVRTKRSHDQTGICYKDVCKEELFYPFSTAYQGESKEKVMAYSLILIFLTIITFFCTKPWL